MGVGNPEDWNWDKTDWTGTADRKENKMGPENPFAEYKTDWKHNEPQTDSEEDSSNVDLGNAHITEDGELVIDGTVIGNMKDKKETLSKFYAHAAKAVLKK